MTTRRILAEVALGLLCLSACWPLVELSKAGSVGVPIVVAALVVWAIGAGLRRVGARSWLIVLAQAAGSDVFVREDGGWQPFTSFAQPAGDGSAGKGAVVGSGSGTGDSDRTGPAGGRCRHRDVVERRRRHSGRRTDRHAHSARQRRRR